MPRHKSYVPHGVLPAVLQPLDAELAIDEAGFREHLNRMKEALVLLGRLPRAHVRPPLIKLQDTEIQRIREVLLEAGLLGRRPLAARLERASVA